MKKIKKALLAVSLMVVGGAALSFGACGEKNTVKYTFNTNGGNSISVEELKIGEEFTLPTPEREGYAFEGWYLTEDFSGAAVTTVKAEKSQTYYAKWTKLSVLTLDANGGSLAQTTLYVKAGANVAEALENVIPTKDGYVFGAWFNGEIALTKNTRMPEDGLTLTAKYKIAYTVEVWQEKMTEDGGDKYEKSAESFVEYDYVGTKIEAAYKLTGFREVDHENAIYETTLTDKASENVLRLYFDRETYTVTFAPNYPAGQQPDDVVHTVKYGTEIDAPSGYMVKGYCLIGWATSSNGDVVYNVGSLDIYNKEGESTASDKVKPDRNLTLYGVWKKGYSDMFGGTDYIYRFDNDSDKVYLWRGDDVNGKYFAGDCYSDGTFEFVDENEDVLVEGRLYKNGTFAYRNAERNGSVATLYDLGSSSFVDTTTILFDAYDGITYIVKDEEGKTTTSEGSYIINKEGFYEVTFKEGELAGKKLLLLVSYATLEDGTKKSAFLVRNDEDLAMGELVRFAAYQGMLTYYTSGQITFDGFGRLAFQSDKGVQNYYYTLEDDKLSILNPDGSVGLVAYIMELELYDGTTKKGYMVYDENFDKTFTLDSGAKLTLDGMYKATYEKGDTVIKGYYGTEQSLAGKTIYSIKDGDRLYKFEITSTTVTVPVEGGEEGETKTETTYSIRELPENYKELFCFVGYTTSYAPVLILNDNAGENSASLYGIGKGSDRSYKKVSTGTYFYNEETGEYVYTVSEVFDVDVLTIKTAVDLKKVQVATFKMDENYAVGVSYWLSADIGEENLKDYAEIYTAADGSTITRYSEYGIYKDKDGNVVVAGIYSGDLFNSSISNTLGVTVYFSVDLTDKTFELLESKSYVNYFVDENLQPLNTEHIRFDGKGNAHYIIQTEEGEETISTIYIGKAVETGETFNGNIIYTYTGELDGETITFRYIVINNYILRENTQYETSYNCEEGLLELDGFRYIAKYTDKEGNSILGGYAISKVNERITVTFQKQDNSVLYFDFADYAANKNFTIRGEEYGDYEVADNNNLIGYTVKLDGYGNASVFKKVDDTLTEVDTNATYTYVDNEIIVTFKEGNKEIKFVGARGYKQQNGNLSLALLISHKEVESTYVNEDDWSLLVLNDAGGAVKYNEYGIAEKGSYILITKDLLYYVSSSRDNCIYKYNVEAGTATPIKFTERGYYTETLESLAFTKSGFAIFNGEDEYFYNMEGDNVIIYRLAKDGETEGVNEYGYVSESFGTFEQEKKWKTNGEEKKYYLSMSHKLTFERKADTAAKYPVLVAEDTYATLENISFTPSGEKEFRVAAKVLIDGKSYNGYAVREIDEETGEPVMYVTVGYYRFDINVTYTGDRLDGTNENSYEIIDMSFRQTLPSYIYLRVIWNAYLLSGAEEANNWKNDYGQIYLNRDFDEEGKQLEFYITGEFFKKTGYDAEGNFFEIPADSTYTEVENMNAQRIEWVGKDGYTYAMYFGLAQHEQLGAVGYYVIGLVRVQEFTTDNGYTVKVERVIYTNEENLAQGSIFSIEMTEGDREVEGDMMYTINNVVTVVERNEDENGKVLSSIHYTLNLTELALGTDEEPEVPEDGELPDGENKEDSEEEKVIIAPFEKVTVTKDENITVVYQEENYAEISSEGVKVVKIDGTFQLPTSSTYDEATQTYTVKFSDGSEYTLKVVGEGQMELTKTKDAEEKE